MIASTNLMSSILMYSLFTTLSNFSFTFYVSHHLYTPVACPYFVVELNQTLVQFLSMQIHDNFQATSKRIAPTLYPISRKRIGRPLQLLLLPTSMSLCLSWYFPIAWYHLWKSTWIFRFHRCNDSDHMLFNDVVNTLSLEISSNLLPKWPQSAAVRLADLD